MPNCHGLPPKQPVSGDSCWGEHLNTFLCRISRPYPKTQFPDSFSIFQKRVLGRSLAIFQAGEAGEGRLAREINEFHTPYIDETYREAIRLFVAEEGRHGKILASMLKELGVKRKPSTRTERLFVYVRRLAGIRAKLLVLLVAELVGHSYYSTVIALLDECPAKAALDEIRNDEFDHLRFHLDFFRCLSSCGVMAGVFSSLVCLVIGLSSFALVALEHRAAVDCMGGNIWGFVVKGWRSVVLLSLSIVLMPIASSVSVEKWLQVA